MSGSLPDLYAQTDGLRDEYGYSLVLPVEEVVTQNLFLRGTRYRDLYMPFDHLLAFGQQGSGDLFFQPVLAGTARDDVFVWDHEDDSRTWFARGVEEALRRWLGGQAR